MRIKKNYPYLVFLFILITPLFVLSATGKDYEIERIYENVTFSVEYDTSSLYFGIEAVCSQWSYYDKPEPYNKLVDFNDFKKFVEDRIGVFPHLINTSESNIKQMFDECLKSEPIKYTNGQIKGQIYIIKIGKDDFLTDCLNKIIPKINSVKLAYIGKNGYEGKALVECEKRKNFLNYSEKIELLKNRYGEEIITEILNYRDNRFIEYLQMLYPYQGENCVRVQNPEDEEGYLIKCYGQEEKCKGCSTKDTCYPIGYRLFVNVPEYCSSNGEFYFQKDDELSCGNNYECKGNICINNKCFTQAEIKNIIDKNLGKEEFKETINEEISKEDIQEEQKLESIEEFQNKSSEKAEELKKKQSESIFVKIISFFKRLFS